MSSQAICILWQVVLALVQGQYTNSAHLLGRLLNLIINHHGPNQFTDFILMMCLWQQGSDKSIFNNMITHQSKMLTIVKVITILPHSVLTVVRSDQVLTWSSVYGQAQKLQARASRSTIRLIGYGLLWANLTLMSLKYKLMLMLKK